MTRMRLRQLARMLAIQRVLVKHGLDEIVWRTHCFGRSRGSGDSWHSVAGGGRSACACAKRSRSSAPSS